jgi:hypothetical protein
VRVDRVSTTAIKLRWEDKAHNETAYDISGLDGQARVIAVALKRYGMIVADDVSNWFITGATGSRWNDDDLNRLKDIPGSAFEVVRSEAAPVTPC